MSDLAWAILIVIGIAFIAFIHALMRQAGNEYAPGAEIPEEDIASAIEGDLRSFVTDENAKLHTGRIVNYTPAEQARMA